jgi:hypothetical protein
LAADADAIRGPASGIYAGTPQNGAITSESQKTVTPYTTCAYSISAFAVEAVASIIAPVSCVPAKTLDTITGITSRYARSGPFNACADGKRTR